jgi:hypothetical protein
MSSVVYALLCLALPQIWAFLVVRIYRSCDNRKALRRSVDAKPPEYTI